MKTLSLNTPALALLCGLALLLPQTGASAQPTAELLHTWNLTPYRPDLNNDLLWHSADGWFYGTCQYGGMVDYGMIFRMSPAGEMEPLVQFTNTSSGNIGIYPRGRLALGADGCFYGTTSAGGSAGFGTVFKMTPSGVLTTLVEFTDNGASNKGRTPSAGVTPGPDGSFYGTTTAGGVHGRGTLFKMTSAGELTTLVEFTGNGASNKGSYPYASLTPGLDGNFYGTTYQGGTSGEGTAFKMSPEGVLTTLVHFTRSGTSSRGGSPYGGLEPAGDGSFYGTTYEGGLYSRGTLYHVTSAGVLTTLVDFADDSRGATPRGSLTLGADGSLYGTTIAGGTHGRGTAFKMTQAGVLTTLVHFSGTSGDSKGSVPVGRLNLGGDGNFYAMTSYGGAQNEGTAFKMTPAGELTTLAEFEHRGITSAGATPWGELTEGADGHLYGMTSEGGTAWGGTIFKMSPAGAVTKLVDFTSNGPTNKGNLPYGSLMRASDGHFYGCTSRGGAPGYGTVFRLTQEGVLTTLVEFSNKGTSNRGNSPRDRLVEGPDGALYGTTHAGGLGFGTVFKMTTGGTLTTLVEFTNTTGGSFRGHSPDAGLVLATDGNFYGTTYSGGTYDRGTIFRVTPAGVATTLVDFTNYGLSNKGSRPLGALVQGPDGSLYGITTQGGTAGQTAGPGTVFKMTLAGVLTTLVIFSDDNLDPRGRYPVGGLVLAADGSFYGQTSQGGTSGKGTVFRMTPAGQHTTLLEFTGEGVGAESGSTPKGGLMADSTGRKLYGMTSSGGGGAGTIFRLEIPMPEIAVSGNGADIASGDVTPAVADHTDFGAVLQAGGSRQRVYVIANTGTEALHLDGTPVVQLSGPDAADFSVSTAPDSVVEAGGQTSFTLTFTPSEGGLRQATVTIASTDADENPFTFAIQGKGRTAPELFADAMQAAGLTGPDAAADAMPQQDGVANLLKHAFNLDLTTQDVRMLAPTTGTAGLPAVTLLPGGGLQVEYLRRVGSGLRYTPHKSPSLAPDSWQPLTSLPQVTTVDTEWERVVHKEAGGTGTRCFFSVEVRLP